MFLESSLSPFSLAQRARAGAKRIQHTLLDYVPPRACFDFFRSALAAFLRARSPRLFSAASSSVLSRSSAAFVSAASFAVCERVMRCGAGSATASRGPRAGRREGQGERAHLTSVRLLRLCRRLCGLRLVRLHLVRRLALGLGALLLPALWLGARDRVERARHGAELVPERSLRTNAQGDVRSCSREAENTQRDETHKVVEHGRERGGGRRHLGRARVVRLQLDAPRLARPNLDLEHDREGAREGLERAAQPGARFVGRRLRHGARLEVLAEAARRGVQLGLDGAQVGEVEVLVVVEYGAAVEELSREAGKSGSGARGS